MGIKIVLKTQGDGVKNITSQLHYLIIELDGEQFTPAPSHLARQSKDMQKEHCEITTPYSSANMDYHVEVTKNVTHCNPFVKLVI